MKTIKILSSFFTIIILLSGCSSKYNRDISYMPADMQKHQEDLLNTNLDLYNKAETDGEKAKYAEEVGFRYMTLGKYDNAINYYEIVLKNDPVNFNALNNLAVMYEEVGEKTKALEFEKKLYENNATNAIVIEDIIRLLIENGKPDDAMGVLQVFAITEEGQKQTDFVSGQFELIRKAQGKS